MADDLDDVSYRARPLQRVADLRELITRLEDEHRRIQATLELVKNGYLPTFHVAPDKPREGMVRLADGTNWNPGTGQGVYCYYNSTWNKLG